MQYYGELRKELATSKNSTRHIWIFAYPTESRADLGSEWVARASVMAFDGKPLPAEPSIDIKLPAPDVDKPTALEEQIHDELMGALRASRASSSQRRIGRRFTTGQRKLESESRERRLPTSVATRGVPERIPRTSQPLSSVGERSRSVLALSARIARYGTGVCCAYA